MSGWVKILAETVYDLDKRNKVQNFRLLTAHVKSHLYFDGPLLMKVYKISAERLQRSYVSWHWRVIQNLKKNWLEVCKITRGIWKIFTRALESLSKNFEESCENKWFSIMFSIYIFLGHDGCFREINLRILWNHIMKNFQIKHGQHDSIIFPKTFSLESSK